MKLKSAFLALLIVLVSGVEAPALTFSLNWKAEPQFGGFYEAERLGLFKELGVPVELKQGGSGTPTLQMLLSGQVEYGIVSADEIVIAAARGNTDIVALFAVYQKNPQAIMVHDSSSAKKLEDIFKGAGTLLWQEGLPYAQFLKKKFSPLKVKTAPYLGGISAFIADQNLAQQCFVTSEPLLAKNQKIPVKTFLVADSHGDGGGGYNPYTTVVAVKRQRLQKHANEVDKMVQILRRSWESYLLDPKPTNLVLQKLNPSLSPLILEQSSAAQKSLIAPGPGQKLGSMTLERWQTLVNQLKDLGIIKTSVDSGALFYNSAEPQKM